MQHAPHVCSSPPTKLTVKVRRELPRERVDRREEHRTLARMGEIVRVHDSIEAVETARVPVEVGWPLMLQWDYDEFRIVRRVAVFAFARCQLEGEMKRDGIGIY